MALSERERRILEEIEDALERDDPRLARRVSKVGDLGRARARMTRLRGWAVVAIVVLMLALLVLAVALT